MSDRKRPKIFYGWFVTSMGPVGCMLTPLIKDNGDLLSFYRPNSRPEDLRRVESIWFTRQTRHRIFFRDKIRIRLYSLGQPAERAARSE